MVLAPTFQPMDGHARGHSFQRCAVMGGFYWKLLSGEKRSQFHVATFGGKVYLGFLLCTFLFGWKEFLART